MSMQPGDVVKYEPVSEAESAYFYVESCDATPDAVPLLIKILMPHGHMRVACLPADSLTVIGHTDLVQEIYRCPIEAGYNKGNILGELENAIVCRIINRSLVGKEGVVHCYIENGPLLH